LKKIIDQGKIARCEFCSVDKEGKECAEVVEKQIQAQVRGIKLKKETAKGKCVICDKKAEEIVYIAREY